MLHRALVLTVAATALLVGGCTVPTPFFCCTDIESCQRKGASAITTCDDPARPYCDNAGEYGASNLCIPDPMTSACTRPEDCMTPARPVCDVDGTGTCVRCDDPSDCTRFAALPACEPVSGACVECVTSAECSSSEEPVCGTDNACRGCELDSECASDVCNKTTGACVPENQIVFVDLAGGGNTCTRAAPCATITAGVAATDAIRRYILVAPGSYSERLSVTGRAFTLIGTGADLSAATVGPLFEIQGASNVSIEGLRIHDGAGGTGDGLRCSDAGGASTLSLTRIRVEDNGGRGVAATNCTLAIEASRIIGNNAGGIVVTGGEAAIRNSFIAKNGGPASTVGGVDLGTPTMLAFEFNTLYDNFATTGFAGGVQCRSGTVRTLSNNIIVGQLADQVSSTNCEFTHTISNEAISGGSNSTTAPTFVDAAGNDFHLQPGSNGIEDGDPSSTVPTDIDGDPRPVPGGGRPDIGADEVQ